MLLMNQARDPPEFYNPFPISLYLVEKQFMRQRLIFLVGVELTNVILTSRVPFLLPDVSYVSPIWTCTILSLY